MVCDATKPLSAVTPVWLEFGRSSLGEAQTWTTWMAPVGVDGDALYRALWLADGSATVTVDLHIAGRPGTRTIHRGRCCLPQNQDQEQTADRMRLLLGMSDRAAAGFRLQSSGLEAAPPYDVGEGATRMVANSPS